MHGGHGEVGLPHLLRQPVHLKPAKEASAPAQPQLSSWAGAGVRTLTFLLVLQKMTAWVMVRVSYRSHRVSNFHSSLSTATKNCLMPSRVSSSLRGRGHHGGRQGERDWRQQSGPGDAPGAFLGGAPGAWRTHRFTRMRMGSVMNLLVISRISWGSVALISTTCVAGGR